ncbi:MULTISPECIES: type I secretion system permease/ATPase [unclassified Psychrobacter]|uniref:type I secretion system permease/ATPase n=1 Tax=unclassified Psychrobacter TaxID=196806 RepID=UPI0025B3F80E|nr:MULTISPECIES: type I secretion system permease/ATPase [unclassified Psychrobacter]MDN3453511.1 type I secretion system permease/ATPase [Psychrobacter sp. APC 3350]MDN3502921.1 type I secretion system permease/ATPase [Psychrobacter sp. 5A.1]
MNNPVPASSDNTPDNELVAISSSPLLAPETDEQLNEQISHDAEQLAVALHTVLTQQGYPIDKMRLYGVLSQQPELMTLASIVKVLEQLGVDQLPESLPIPDAAFLPLLALHPTQGWGIIDQKNPQGLWQFKQTAQSDAYPSATFTQLLRIRLDREPSKRKQLSFDQILKKDLKNYRGIVIEAVVASFLINMLALAVSLFSMQVYDRVIPTRSEYTLIILASGVGLVILFETFMKFARSKIMDKVVVNLDQHLSREVFQRLLSVRIDQMPGSVGSMAAQLRGYEQVRGFYTASTLFGLVDIPMAIIFVSLIVVIGNPLVALVPIIAAIVAIVLGWSARKKIDSIAAVGASASYRKTGILVETVEGIETIKAGAGNWKFLSRWLDVMNITTKNDLDMKHANDNLSYLSQMIQQTSYVGIVIVGSFVVMSGDMTMGGLIACSILGGRILAPVMSIPSLLVQHSHAKAAKLNIEQLFSLQQDNHGVAHPLSPSRIIGNFDLEKVTFNYQNNDQPALAVNKLEIKAGERIAVLGAIGSGKSTLLKVLSGLYAPTQGRILLDGLDIQQISRESLSEQVGYLQQDHRLFEGTLRENLLIGLPAPSDDVMRDALVKTGLIKLVASHSSGLDLPISEGGKGLSGGQKQLVAFTRLLLTKPAILLMDEPTASMDNRQELQCINALSKEFGSGSTIIVATHKMPLLQLVDRIIIMDNQQVVMDGPKARVLEQLKGNDTKANANKTSIKVSKPKVKVISNEASSASSATDNRNNPDNLGQENG